jgi:hypothetical protein
MSLYVNVVVSKLRMCVTALQHACIEKGVYTSIPTTSFFKGMEPCLSTQMSNAWTVQRPACDLSHYRIFCCKAAGGHSSTLPYEIILS